MKFKVKAKRGIGVVSLTLEGDKDDEIDYTDAERVRRGEVASFTPLVYEKKGKVYHISYQTTGLLNLSDLVKEPFTPRRFHALALSFLRLMRDCEENKLMRQRVALDPDKILFDRARGVLRFVYVPLQSFVSSSADMNGALTYLCEHAQVPYAETGVRDAVLDYARRTPIITGIEFGAFLKRIGILQDDNANVDVGECADQSWLSTDHLGDCTSHGLDFVSLQVQQAVAEYECRQKPESIISSPVVKFDFVRLADGARWVLQEGRYLVGRSPECEIALDDVRGLSRKHAEITVRADSCSVYDLDSTNGVRVNGSRIAPSFEVPLHRGDRVKLGADEFEVR